jgi:hypothetical protein
LVYVVVAHVAPPNTDRRPPIEVLAPVLGLLALVIATGSIVYRRRALAEPIQAGHLDPKTPEGFQRAFTPFILNLVLAESVAILGLILSLLSSNPIYSIAFTAAGLALMYVHRPTAPDLNPPAGGGHAAA